MDSQIQKATADFSPMKILLPTDGSENSIRASGVAISLSKTYGCTLVVVEVIPTFRFAGAFDIPKEVFDEYSQYMNRDAQRNVDSILTSARSQGILVKGEVRNSNSNSVTESILDCAKEEKVDLIVIGTRGLGSFEKLILGSISSGVVSHAECNVLVVR